MNKMIRKIRERTAPPVFPGEAEKTRVAALLYTNLVYCTIAIFLLLVASVVRGVFTLALPVLLADFVILLSLQILLRRGFVRLSSFFLVALLTISVTDFIYQLGTVRAPAAAVYLVLSSLLAGLLISRQAAFFSACLNCIIYFVLFLAEKNGLMPPATPTNIVQIVAFGFGAIWAVVLVNQAMQSIDDSRTLAQRELSEHQRADELAQYRSAILEKVIQLGKNVTEVADFRTTLMRIWAGIRSELDFDRVAIFLYNSTDNSMDGALGTDRVGNLQDIRHLKYLLTPTDPFNLLLSRPDGFQFVPDYAASLDQPPSAAMVGVKEHVSVAVWAGDKPVAVITADQLLTQRPISEAQLEALRFFSGYAGLAIENARLNERKRSWETMLEKVIRLGKMVTEVSDIQMVLLRIWEGVRKDLDFDRLGLFIYEKETNCMVGSYGTDRNGSLSEEWDYKSPLTGDDFYSKVFNRPDGYYFSKDYESDVKNSSGSIMEGVKFYAAVSCWAGDKPVAIICVDQLVTGRQITEEQLEALRLFSGYAGLAIENARLGRYERARREMLEKVIHLGKLVTEVADYRTVLSKIYNGVRKELDFDRLGLFIYDADSGDMRGSFGTNRDGDMVEEWDLSFSTLDGNFFSTVIGRPDGYYFTTDYEKERNLRPGHIMRGVKYYAAVSAWANDRPVAMFCVDQLTSGRPITQEQLEALRLFAGYAGPAIQNARLTEREHSRQAMLEKVIRLGKVVTEGADYRTVLLRIYNSARDDLGFDRCGLFIYDPKRETMRGSFGTDRFGNLIEEWDLEVPLNGSSFFGTLIRNPDGYLFTADYEQLLSVPENEIMSNVKYYAAVSAWKNDQPVAILCVDQLISGRRITDEQMEALRLFAGYVGLAIENTRLRSELEQRVSERTAELESANRDLESFSYSVSHDLRAPLRAIIGFSRILNDDFSPELSPLAQGFLNKINDSGLKMGQLVEALLNFSRMGRKPLILQPVDMNAMVRSTLETLALETSGRQIEWVLADLPPANADPSLIQQVYANLIGNAIKYSRRRELARIEIGCLVGEDGQVYFVRDNGAGFDMQFSDRLFGVFQRLHREDEFEGTGIGLAIVHRIIQRHGGRIWAEAEVDKGATFYFTLVPSPM